MHEILPLKEIATKQIGAKKFVQLKNPHPPPVAFQMVRHLPGFVLPICAL